MRAIQLQEIGDLDALAAVDVPRPAPDADELLVRVHATGVNPLDWLVCRGRLSGLLDEPLPWTPGWDVSGIVESVGGAVTGYEPGDAVYGMVRLPGAGGTFAEYVRLTPAELAGKPACLSHIEAAAIPMVAQTAYHALFAEAGLETGQRVLVHAAAGGVGHVAVQLATAAGATVAGTASSRNEAFLRDLGVDEFVDYRERRFEDAIDPVDVVLDGVGGAVLERSAEVLEPGGVVVTLPEQPPVELVREFREEHAVETRFFSVTDESDPATFQTVTDRIEAGVLKPTVSETYPLAAARTALEESAAGHVRGKLVLTVREDGSEPGEPPGRR